MDALAFIDKQGKARRQPYYVLSGDEDLLKRHALALIETIVLGDADPEYAVTNYPGDKAEFSTVRNELDSVSFFSERRLVVVDQADPFVTKFRPQLEAYVAAPSESGVLVLDVKTFPSTTKLAKAVPDLCHIDCKPPKEAYFVRWCSDWCFAQYGKKLPPQAAGLLVDLVGQAMGVIDQELQKLKDYVGERPSIDAKDVEELVGRSREANVFLILDAIGDGQPAAAFAILEELFTAGEACLRVLGAVGSRLRLMARVNRLVAQGVPFEEAMTRANVTTWPKIRDGVRKQMRHLGRARLDKLYDWLLELDSGLKGGNPLPDQAQLERLIVRLARPIAAKR